jgi:hypothetical protein
MTDLNKIRQLTSLIILAEGLKTLNCLNYVNCFTASGRFLEHTVKIDETVDTVTEYQ